jgi:chromosome segregation ATPase
MAINGKGKPTQFVDYFGKRWAQVHETANHYISLSTEQTLKKNLQDKVQEIAKKDSDIASLNQSVTKLQGENSQLKTDKTNLENKLNVIPADWKQQIDDAKKQITDAYKLLKVSNNEEIKTLLNGKEFKKIAKDADDFPAAAKERDDLKKNINALETHLKDFQGEVELTELENKLASLNKVLFTNLGLEVTYSVLRETIEGMIALDKANRERLGGV